MLLELSIEPHVAKNVNVHWQELLNVKTYIYVSREQWPAYFQPAVLLRHFGHWNISVICLTDGL